jgi:hypothetical protein
VSGWPDTCRVKFALGSTVSVTFPPEAVKGPIAAGGDGRLSVTPDCGTELGMGVLKCVVPPGILEGVAPVASTWVTAEPDRARLPRAAAAVTNEARMLTCV